MNEFFAGFVSGVAGLIVGSPFDIYKITCQSSRPSRLTWRPSSWFVGLLAPMITLGLLNAILFWSYKIAIDQMDDSLYASFLAGGFSGLCGSAISIPAELVKVQAQTSDRSSLDIIRTTKNFYKGWEMTLPREVLGYAFYFLPFKILSSYNILFAGGVAGCIAWAVIFPLDTVKTRMQADTLIPQSVNNIIKDIYTTHGITGFFNGLFIAMIRAFIVNAVIFYIDSIVKIKI